MTSHLAGQQVYCPSCESLIAVPTGPPDTHALTAKSNSAKYIILGVIAAIFFCCMPVGSVFFAARSFVDLLADPTHAVRDENNSDDSLADPTPPVKEEDSVYSLGGPKFAVQDKDYAVARKQFQTKLIRRGPSPQDWDPLVTPPGAVEITYQSDGLNLKAFVDPQPAKDEKYPAVLFLHGGFAYGDVDWKMPQPYREAGFIVMMPILRGENGQPGTFTLFFDEVDDVLAAGKTLAELPYVDEENVFIAGHSAGGTLTSLAAAATNRFRAAASLSGSMNQTINIDKPELLVFDIHNDWREVFIRSPEAYATSFKCPIRFYYGNQEIVIIRPNQRTGESASAAGLDAKAVQVPGDHFTSVPPAIRKSIPFFNQHRK